MSPARAPQFRCRSVARWSMLRSAERTSLGHPGEIPFRPIDRHLALFEPADVEQVVGHPVERAFDRDSTAARS